MDGRDASENAVALPVIAAGTMACFYFIWAAAHDIAHGEADVTLEYFVLAACVPVFAFLYRSAVRSLPSRSMHWWLVGTAALIVLFDMASISAILRPKYPLDPTLGAGFLLASMPALWLIGRRLASARRAQTL